MNEENILEQLKIYNDSQSKSHLTLSKQALKNKYTFFNGFDTVKFKNEIDWNYKHHHSVNTYQIYLHSLNIVRDLTKSFIIKGEQKYIIKAKSIIEEWVASESNDDFFSKNSSWKDHSTSSRIKNFIYFQQNCPNDLKFDNKFFQNLLIKHCEFLADSKFYAENNHGMMSDESLLFSSFYLDDIFLKRVFSDKSILRMERIIFKLFSTQAYNLENSPEYHRLTQNSLEILSI